MTGRPGRAVDVTIVDACLRDGGGGSPTGVVVGAAPTSDGDRRRIVSGAGTSHVAFVEPGPRAGGSRAIRFFTTKGELSGCGHGTIAAHAVLAGGPHRGPYRCRQVTAGRPFDVTAVRGPRDTEVWFDQGTVERRPPPTTGLGALLAALGLHDRDLYTGDEPTVASPGTPRLLVPVADPAVLRALGPDRDALAGECRRLGYLGCFVYVPPTATRRVPARMFAPAIGVPEDVANANSAGCLAAHLLSTGRPADILVDQGDVLGRPATVYARAEHTPTAPRAWVGGAARVRRRVTVDLAAAKPC